MARSREFNPDTVLDAALDLFWRKGFKNCSMADVVKKTGVARYGLYRAFKDKDHLYCCTLRRYRQKIAELMLAPFQREDKAPDYQTLVDHFEQMLEELEKGEHQGCFAHQAAIERAGAGGEIDALIKEHFESARQHYRVAIENAIAQGQIRDLPIEDLVTYVMGIQRAVIAMSKQNCSLEERKTYVHCSMQLLKS